jgi:hypothetical protein
MNLNFEFSPTISEFLQSDREICFLIGPQGEGKTWGWIFKILDWALDHQKRGARMPISAAIIRDTHENIKKHTVNSIQKMLGSLAQFKDDYRKMIIPGLVDCDLFGANNLAALGKLQASEYHIKVLEEPAPIVLVGNAGIPEEFFNVCCARGPRESGAKHQVIVSMNPSDEEHWTYHHAVDDPQEGTRVFWVERGENKFLPEEERERVRRAYAHRSDLLARYDRGEFSYVVVGEAVTPEYNEKLHRAEHVLNPMPKVTTFRFWDGGYYKACVIGQITPRGQFIITDSLREENVGFKQLIQAQLKPLLNERYGEIVRWRDLGDQTIANRDSGDSSVSAATIIEGELDTHFEGGENGWEARKEALKELLNRNVDGVPMLQLSHHEGMLHRALRGGWHYHKDNVGRVLREIPVKDAHSAVGDAFSHGITRIFGYKQIPFTKRVERRKFANSYGIPQLGKSREKHATF